MNGWYFLATEVDDICFDYATKNVEQNNLSDLIKGKCGPLIPNNNVSQDIRPLHVITAILEVICSIIEILLFG